jgi:hypothetical protein
MTLPCLSRSAGSSQSLAPLLRAACFSHLVYAGERHKLLAGDDFDGKGSPAVFRSVALPRSFRQRERRALRRPQDAMGCRDLSPGQGQTSPSLPPNPVPILGFFCSGAVVVSSAADVAPTTCASLRSVVMENERTCRRSASMSGKFAVRR